MRVTIKLFAHFRDSRFKVENREIPAGTTVGEIIDSLGIDREEVGVLMINSRHAAFDSVLDDNCMLAIFPMIGGG